jgi:hypothetical protein
MRDRLATALITRPDLRRSRRGGLELIVEASEMGILKGSQGCARV